jgi:serine/threonine protein kinase
MGDVYRALDMKLEREVALKVLPAALAADPELVVRLRREARMLATLNHPNIAAIMTWRSSKGIVFWRSN